MSPQRLLLAALVLAAGLPFFLRGVEHPLVAGGHRLVDSSARPGDPAAEPIQEIVDSLDAELPPDASLGLRWLAAPDPGAVGFLWVTTAYRAAPRTVYPLLSAVERDALVATGRLDAKVAEALGDRARRAATGEAPGVALAWGTDAPCRDVGVAGWTPERRVGPACLLRGRGP